MSDELIARLEAATEGSRELDCRIAYHLGWRHNAFRESGEIKDCEFKRIMDMAGSWHVPGDVFPDILNKAEYRKGDAEGRWPDEPPHYTTSLDAAMTLIQPPWTRDVDATAPESGIDVGLHYPGIDGRKVVGIHNSEPIATVIAALKARALDLSGGE